MKETEVDQLIKQNRIYRIDNTPHADMFKAYAAWLPLAEACNVKAQYNIAYCLSTGRGVDVHRKRAAEWLMKAAAQGDMQAHYSLFLAYRAGEGVGIDEAKAYEYLQKAADLGDARAFFELGRRHFRTGNQADALKMFAKAKEAKHQDADKGIGLLQSTFTFGRGIQQRKVEKTNKTYTNPTITFTVRNSSESNLLFGCDLNSIDEKGNVTRKSVDIPMTPIGGSTSEALEMFPGVDMNETVELYQYRVSYNRSQASWTPFPLGNPIVLWTPADSKKYRSACFVVTVCMEEDKMSPEDLNPVEIDPVVLTFRHFRDEVLNQYKLGRIFSMLYYRHGPAMAAWVRKHNGLRVALRTLFRIVAKILPRPQT